MTSLTKWSVVFSAKAEKDFSKLDRPVQQQVIRFLEERIEQSSNPRSWGKPLQGDLTGFWSYRIGSYRILCKIDDKAWVVVAISIGHRRDVYEK